MPSVRSLSTAVVSFLFGKDGSKGSSVTSIYQVDTKGQRTGPLSECYVDANSHLLLYRYANKGCT